jgi:FKBP-type peptidyl-prolyl cis-trans isomerase
MIFAKRFAAVLAASLGLIAPACGGNSSIAPTPPSAPYSQADLVVGTGATAVNGSRVTVAYAGWVYDNTKTDGKGVQFDANTITFVLGAGSVISGWDRGLAGMKVGGQRRLVIPPDLAYGANSPSPLIPANATLVFDVTLLGVS